MQGDEEHREALSHAPRDRGQRDYDHSCVINRHLHAPKIGPAIKGGGSTRIADCVGVLWLLDDDDVHRAIIAGEGLEPPTCGLWVRCSTG